MILFTQSRTLRLPIEAPLTALGALLGTKSLYLLFFILYFIFYVPLLTYARVPEYSTTEILRSLDRLEVFGSALYIAAHPDDENTAVLAYLSNDRLVRTAYLTLTRGGGGQNLLGNEKGPLLGVVRTQELLAARRIDRAEQFFTRAVDFGYSKSAEETFKNWNRDQVLEDMVYVIRLFRPDVIIMRFTPTRGGHGHHTASAILAEEAFYAASDPGQFKSQLTTLKPWRAKRLVWDAWAPTDKAISLEIGKYNPVLGKTYQETAAASRSMHKTQGFGSGPGRGSQVVSFEHTAGDSAVSDLFDGIELSARRLGNGSHFLSKTKEIRKHFDPRSPSFIIPQLTELYQILQKQTGYWADRKKTEVADLIRMCSGLWLEAIVWQPGADRGDMVDVRLLAVNRSPFPISLERIGLTFAGEDTILKAGLEDGKPVSVKRPVMIPESAPYTNPYWLDTQDNGKMYTLSDVKLTGLAETPPALTARFDIRIAGIDLSYDVPVLFRETDPVKGEVTYPFRIRPGLSLWTEYPATLFSNGHSRKVRVFLESKSDSISGLLRPIPPAGWQAKPASVPFTLMGNGAETIVTFEIIPGINAGDIDLRFEAIVGKARYSHRSIEIAYPHISLQMVLIPAATRLVNLDINIELRRIGYIMGSGDDIPDALIQLGYDVHLLTDDELENCDLSDFNVIICGVRAFNTRDKLERLQKRLITFVENGGTWIVQHNTRFGNRVEQIGPYPFSATGRDRISEEDAEIQILLPDHPLMNLPNKITAKDFEGWVQERGLYFADTWEGKLYPILSVHDEGEPAKLGGLLYARYGKGTFIYTAYAWFRQLPAGVPGAYRLFVNLISAKGTP